MGLGWRKHDEMVDLLVGSQDLVHPATERCDAGIDGRGSDGAGAASKGDNANSSSNNDIIHDLLLLICDL